MAGLPELNSFVGKFLKLWQSGCDASLHLKTRDGKATINLQLGLGQAPPPPFSKPPPRHVPGPSRQRRTQRRALAREQAEQAQAKNNVEEVAENANEDVAKNESESAEIATEVVENDGTTADKAAEASEEARKDFHCLICDFVSSWETALQIHMSKKHPAQAPLAWKRFFQHKQILQYSTHKTHLKLSCFISFRINKHNNRQ